MRPPSSDEDVPLESPSPRQGDKTKRKRASSSPSSEKKKTKRSLVRKPMGSTSARAPYLDSLHWLRDESEEEEENFELVACVRSGLEVRGGPKPVRAETELPRLGVIDEGALSEASDPERGEAALH